MRGDVSADGGRFSEDQVFFNYRDYFKDDLSIALHSMKRLDVDVFFDIANLMNIKKDQLAVDIFDISPKTISRYKQQSKKLNARDSETALKLLSLYHKGKKVFGKVDSFNRWLHKSSFGLGGRIPYNLLGTLTGIDLIIEELTRIEYGDLA